MTYPVAIDPFGCGCTECLTGEYIPLERATTDQVKAMLVGRLRDNTGTEFLYREGVLSCETGSWILFTR